MYLVNAQHIKDVPCKKSDILDCQWLQQLHTYGLLQASFRPTEEICALRALVRHRDNLIRYRGAHIQHMQKALQLMNVQLTNVISDITGQTGMLIIRAIVAGERDRLKLAQFRHPGCRSSEAEIAKSLQGNYRPDHLFALQQALELYDFYNQQIQACDTQIEAMYQAFQPAVDLDTEPLPPARKRSTAVSQRARIQFATLSVSNQRCRFDPNQWHRCPGRPDGYFGNWAGHEQVAYG